MIQFSASWGRPQYSRFSPDNYVRLRTYSPPRQDMSVPQYKSPDERLLSMNFGPQHPAAHGVLRLMLQTKGEVSSFSYQE